MTLQQYLKKHGCGPTAKKIGIDRNAVHQWLHKQTLPSAKNMRALVHISEGTLTYEEIIEPFFKNVRQS